MATGLTVAHDRVADLATFLEERLASDVARARDDRALLLDAVSSFGAMAGYAAAPEGAAAKWLGLAAVVLASVNIFGGFAVTERMLAMYKKKDRPAR